MHFLRNSLIVIILSTSVGKAQEIFNSIVVDSATFTPMPYVNVLVKNKNKGTVTDENGKFSLQATRNDTLLFSFVGYNTATYSLHDWEPGLIRLSEKKIILKNVTIQSKAINPYQGMFDDENAKINARHNRFYYSRERKEKRRLIWLKEDNIRAQTYVDVMINSTDLKEWLIKKYGLTDEQYYTILARFNEKNADVMYYITAGELVTLVKNFYALALR